MTNPLRISLAEFTLELTAEQVEGWACEYGIDPTPEAIRADIKTYVLTTLQSSDAWSVARRSRSSS